jgi:hypothetical protein
MERVIRISFEMRRSADLEEICVVDDEEWETIQKAKENGVSIYLGEVAGKHSEVTVTLDDDCLEVLSEDPKDAEVLNRLIGGHAGHYIVSAVLEAMEGWEDESESDNC